MKKISLLLNTIILFSVSNCSNLSYSIKRNPELKNVKTSILFAHKTNWMVIGSEASGQQNNNNNSGYSALGSGLGNMLIQESNKNGLKTLFADQMADLENTDIDAYIVKRLNQALNEKKMFKAEIEDSYVMPNAFERAPVASAYYSIMKNDFQIIRNDYFLTYAIESLLISGNKKAATPNLRIIFTLSDKKANKAVWRYTASTSATVQSDSKTELKETFFKLLDFCIDSAMTDLHSE